MHGPLNEIGLIEVLQLLERGKRTGILRVIGPDPTAPRTLHVSSGLVVALDPDAGDPSLATALANRHLATLEPDPSGSGPESLPLAMREGLRVRLATQALAAMLHWIRGRFDFEEHAVPAGPLALSTEAIVLDVVAGESRRVDLAQGMMDFHVIPEFAAPEHIGEGLAPELGVLDWRVLDAVDGTRDVAAIAASLGEPLEDVAERVRALEGAAILVLQAAPARVAVDARAAIEAGRYDEAATLLRGRVAAVPGDGEAWRALGLAEIGAGRFDRAIEAWETWGAADPGRAGDAASLMGAARTMLEALHDVRD